MFKQRLITVLVLAPLALFCIYYSNLTAMMVVATLVTFICALEWQKLIPLFSFPYQCIFLLSVLLFLFLIHFMFHYWLVGGLIVWFIMWLAIIFFPRSQVFWGYPIIVASLALILLPLFSQSFIAIYQLEKGKALIVYLILLVWGADIGAYCVGKLWGKIPLIPAVSPGKTLEGLFGGMMLSLGVAFAGYVYFAWQTEPFWQKIIPWLSMALFVFIMALFGDLFISILKRRVHIKDTGNLFPGHGGMLDRMDSLMAATPAFYFAIQLAH